MTLIAKFPSTPHSICAMTISDLAYVLSQIHSTPQVPGFSAICHGLIRA